MPYRAQRVWVYLRTSWFSGIITDDIANGTTTLAARPRAAGAGSGRCGHADRGISVLDTNRAGGRGHRGDECPTDREFAALPGLRHAGDGARVLREPARYATPRDAQSRPDSV